MTRRGPREDQVQHREIPGRDEGRERVGLERGGSLSRQECQGVRHERPE